MNYINSLKDSARIDADDVSKFRSEVFGDGIVSKHEAQALFALNDEVADSCAEWDAFFVEAMIDYCLNQAEPEGYLTESEADWLINQISKDGHIKSDTELELLVRLIERARHKTGRESGHK